MVLFPVFDTSNGTNSRKVVTVLRAAVARCQRQIWQRRLSYRLDLLIFPATVQCNLSPVERISPTSSLNLTCSCSPNQRVIVVEWNWTLGVGKFWEELRLQETGDISTQLRSMIALIDMDGIVCTRRNHSLVLQGIINTCDWISQLTTKILSKRFKIPWKSHLAYSKRT